MKEPRSSTPTQKFLLDPITATTTSTRKPRNANAILFGDTGSSIGPSTPRIDGHDSDEDAENDRRKRRSLDHRHEQQQNGDVIVRVPNSERTNSLGGGLFGSPLSATFAPTPGSRNAASSSRQQHGHSNSFPGKSPSGGGRKASFVSTATDSSAAPRRTSPWRLFDANGVNNNAGVDSTAGNGGFLISKGEVAPRRSVGNRIRTLSTHGLADGSSKRNNKTGSRGSLATQAARDAQQVVATITTSVGELISNVFRGATGGGANNNNLIMGGGAGNHMSAFESDVRGVSRESVVTFAPTTNTGQQTNNTSAHNSNSNVSFAGYSSGRQERKGSFAESSQVRQSNGSAGSQEDLDQDRQSLIQTIPQRHLNTIRSKNSIDLNNLNQLLNAKILFVPPNGGFPISTFSVICSIDNQPREKKRRPKSLFGSQPFGDRLGFAIEAVKRKAKVESYQRLIEPTGTLGNLIPDYDMYNPFSLDDPELKTGKHRTVIKLQSYVSSILLYSRPADIKKELNEVFRETHPTVDPTLMLSQIRSLKVRMINVGKSVNMELSSVASAIVYFEKLVFKKFATRENRRLVASVCLLLAAKVNDPKEFNYQQLLESIETVMQVSQKEVFQQEFSAFVALEFTLFIPPWQLMPHLERIIEVSDFSHSSKPLGEESEPASQQEIESTSCFNIYKKPQYSTQQPTPPRNTQYNGKTFRQHAFRGIGALTVFQQEECDPAEIIDTILVDAAGRHAVRIVSVIGTGSFAHVYLAESVSLLETDEAFVVEKRAVKRLFKAGLDERQLLLQRQEAEVMKAMAPHQNVIQLLATVEDEHCLYLIMEYCELDLYEAITQQGGFPEDVVKEVFVQIADSVIHCHTSGFYHRDLKPENCLISTANYKVKLADFGLTTTDDWSTELGCGSVRYMAPECFELTHNTPDNVSPGQPVPPPAKSLPVPPGVLNGGYSPAANDVWALGVILLNLLFGKNPWFEAHMTDAIFSAFAGAFPIGAFLQQLAGFSNPNILRQQFNLTLQFDAILRRVFELDPRRRCSVQDLKQMVESCTHFVELDPPTPAPVHTPISQQTKLKRRGHSSILAGPGYIVNPGEPVPVLFLQQQQQQQLEENGAAAATSSVNSTGSPPEPIRKLRMQPTFASLKAVAAGEVPISATAGDRNSVLVPGATPTTPTTTSDDMLLAEDSTSSIFSPTVSTVGVGAEHSRRVSMSSSSTARDDGEGEFIVVETGTSAVLGVSDHDDAVDTTEEDGERLEVSIATVPVDEILEQPVSEYHAASTEQETTTTATTTTTAIISSTNNVIEVDLEEGEIVEVDQQPAQVQDVAAVHQTVEEADDRSRAESHAGVIIDPAVLEQTEEEEEKELPENPELMRRLMQEQHVDKMMREINTLEDDEEEDDDECAVVVRTVEDGSLKATISSLAATTLTAYTGGRDLDESESVEQNVVVDAVSVADVSEPASIEVIASESTPFAIDTTVSMEQSPTAVPSVEVTTPTPQLVSPTMPESVTSLPPVASTIHEPTQAPQSPPPPTAAAIIQPPAMARHDSNPYIPPPRHSLATDLSPTKPTSVSSKENTPRRSSSPMKWFAPFISRETARLDQPPSVAAAAAASQSGRVGFFGARKRPSIFRMRKQTSNEGLDHTVLNGISGASLSSRSSTPFGMLRNRKSSQYFTRHVSGGSSVLNHDIGGGNGIVTLSDEGTTSSASNSTANGVLVIEEDINMTTPIAGKKPIPRKGSTLSMKELSSGLKGALGMGRKRSGLLNGERTN
ncbi:UNVERIFIED_CONTAM: hypothetical protein HDU68_011134 [Siphonaria sp. JEL0065]|nr:hypothetical protein HDU68_011134 [Siphonaria sp. JEL0065]